jgi:hypothetical protein
MTEQGVALNTCPAASSSRHDHSMFNPQSKPRPRAGVRGLRRSAKNKNTISSTMFSDLIKLFHKIMRYSIHVFMVAALLAIFTFAVMLLTGYTQLGEGDSSNLSLYAILIGCALLVLVQWKMMLVIFSWVSKRQLDFLGIEEDSK